MRAYSFLFEEKQLIAQTPYKIRLCRNSAKTIKIVFSTYGCKFYKYVFLKFIFQKGHSTFAIFSKFIIVVIAFFIVVILNCFATANTNSALQDRQKNLGLPLTSTTKPRDR